jgi:hypothetical protein
MQVGADGNAAPFVGGIDQAVEPFGGVGADRQQPDVIDYGQVRSQDATDGLGDRVVGPVAADQRAELFQGEPGDVLSGFDGGLAEALKQEGLAGAGGPADDQVLVPADPFQGAQCLLGGGRDGGQALVPGVEGLPGGEGGAGAAGGQRGAVPAGDFLGQQGAEHLGGVPALRFGDSEHVGCDAAHVRQPHPPQQLFQPGVQ